MVERGPKKAGVASPILALGTIRIAWQFPLAFEANISAFPSGSNTMDPVCFAASAERLSGIRTFRLLAHECLEVFRVHNIR